MSFEQAAGGLFLLLIAGFALLFIIRIYEEYFENRAKLRKRHKTKHKLLRFISEKK